MRTRTVLMVVVLAFAAGLGAAIGWRLPGDAMAVLVGVAAGVGASIPTSLLIVWVTTRQMRAQLEELDARAEPANWAESRREGSRGAAPGGWPTPGTLPAAAPPVIVVQPAQAAQAAPWGGGYYPAPAAVAPRRQFSVIGDENNWDE